jgi:hypothetical protein
VKRVLGVALVAIASAGPVATAQQPKDTGAEAATFDTAPWREEAVKLPSYPKDEHLVRFDTGPTSALRFFIDRDSLSVGDDGVVRFTLVAKADGASNVSYEGIRCPMRERKVYAYGRPDGTWHEARNPQWVRIGPPVTDLHRFVLWNFYFCPERAPIRSASEGLDALKLGGHPKAADSTLPGFPVAR